VGIPSGRVPVLAWPLGYVYPPNRWSPIGAGFKPRADLLNSQFQFTLKLLDAFPIDAACPMPVDRPPSLLEELPV